MLGQTYKIRTDLDAVRAEAVSSYVSEKVKGLEQQARGHGKLDIIILAALDIANDCLEARLSTEHLTEATVKRTQGLIHKIESVIR
ncbi:MAG: cell division protein ZapA [Pseudomonadota bacterium]